MDITKLVAQARSEIVAAYMYGGVSAAATAYAPYSAFREAILHALTTTRIPLFLLERICFRPRILKHGRY